MTHDELVLLGRKWLSRPLRGDDGYRSRCALILTGLVALTSSGEIPDVIGWEWRESHLIECKTSVADFRADRQKPFRRVPELGMGKYRWYLAPAGVIPHDEVPANWGLLEVGKRNRIAIIRKATAQPYDACNEIALLLSELRRRPGASKYCTTA